MLVRLPLTDTSQSGRQNKGQRKKGNDVGSDCHRAAALETSQEGVDVEIRSDVVDGRSSFCRFPIQEHRSPRGAACGRNSFNTNVNPE